MILCWKYELNGLDLMFMFCFEEFFDLWKMRWGRGILMFSVMKEKMGKWFILNEEKFINI